MTAAIKDVLTDQYGTPDIVLPQLLNFPVAASTTIFGGTMVGTDASGNAVPASATSTLALWGRAERQVVNTTVAGFGAAGALNVEIHAGVFYFTNDSTNPVTNASRGKYVYAVDDNTVGTSDLGGTLPLAGYVIDVPASGAPEYLKVAVAVGLARPDALDPELASSSASFKARGVAANLAALTFTGGTFTANANGALATQDGLTIAANQILIFPTGTITTGVVSAANSGPWIITSVGGASAKVTGIRPDWWPQGGAIIPGSVIRVAAGTLFGGTEWASFADVSLFIGTDDPALYPRQVTQQVTLAAGTKTISNVPIFATTRLGLAIALVGGTPDATTTGINFRITSGRTAGGIGTAAAIIDAQAVLGGAKVAGDVSVVNATLING